MRQLIKPLFQFHVLLEHVVYLFIISLDKFGNLYLLPFSQFLQLLHFYLAVFRSGSVKFMLKMFVFALKLLFVSLYAMNLLAILFDEFFDRFILTRIVYQ